MEEKKSSIKKNTVSIRKSNFQNDYLNIKEKPSILYNRANSNKNDNWMLKTKVNYHNIESKNKVKESDKLITPSLLKEKFESDTKLLDWNNNYKNNEKVASLEKEVSMLTKVS